MMQTVIRWRRPSHCEYSRYHSLSNPCSYLFSHSVCYVVSGCLLLVVGVIITSLTFQNLDSSNGENKERYAGPVLIAAGVLVMARVALSGLWPLGRSMSSRRRSLLRRYISEIYSRPIFALQRHSTFSLGDLQVSSLYHLSRARLYSDDPPSYDTVTSDDYLYADVCVHAYTNPVTDLEDDLVSRHAPPTIVITTCPQQDLYHEEYPPPSAEDNCPPPSYDEYIMSENMKISTL